MMQYKYICLTKKESKDASMSGFAYVYKNKDRWKDLPNLTPEDIGNYNYGTSFIVIDNVAYTMFKDYCFPEDNVRLYVLRNRGLGTDIVEDEETESTESEG